MPSDANIIYLYTLALNHHEMPSEPVAGTGSTCGTYWVHGGVFFNVYFAAEMAISCI